MAVGRLVALVLPAIAGCSVLVDIPGPVGQDEGDLRRKAILIDADLEDPVEDFVLSVVLNGDADLAAIGSRENIRFTDEDDEPLLYEIELFDRERGDLAAWVTFPVVNADATLFYMYYGGPPVEPPDPPLVWPDRFASVWHMQEPAPPYHDSTGSGITILLDSAEPPIQTDGIVGHAVLFTEDGDQRLRIADPAGGELDFGADTFAMSMWVRVEESLGVDGIPWTKGGLVDADPGYAIKLGATDWVSSISDGSDQIELVYGPEGDFLGNWTQLGMQVDREGSFCVYAGGFEGLCTDNLVGFGTVDNADDVEVGRSFEGRIDEIRIYRGGIPRGALPLENQARLKPDFLQVGDQERP